MLFEVLAIATMLVDLDFSTMVYLSYLLAQKRQFAD